MSSVKVMTVIKAESEPDTVLLAISTKLTPEVFLSPAEQVEVLLVSKDKTTKLRFQVLPWRRKLQIFLP